MISLPKDFLASTRALFGDERFDRYLAAFDQVAPVSIRLNPLKPAELEIVDKEAAEPVPWCRYGYYLAQRPEFTFDPLFHAGCYYVQEAASMFLAQVMKQYVKGDVNMLDLCAAPGGKSTCARSMLTEGALLICNEPVHNRSNILFENITKWGWGNTIVTNNYPSDFRKVGLFDVILADVPCSGEGMFRKDKATIAEWSLENVEKCWRLQRDIVAEIWKNLKDGGIMIYSTCTFNTKENEENVRWICKELGADVMAVDAEDGWGITGSLLQGYNEPVYRFIPGTTKSEGLFMAVLRKYSDGSKSSSTNIDTRGLKIITAESLGKSVSIEKALLVKKAENMYPAVEVTREMALDYLSREAVMLPKDTPKGLVLITYKGMGLGFAKNIGNRANNLYPQYWAIRTKRR